jgi:hypothetical protein
MCVKGTMKEQVVEWKVFVYSTFLIILFIPKVLFTQSDGDSKAYQRVIAEKPYDPNIPVTKLECVGHVKERMGARLRRLVKENTGTKLHDSKPLGGKGRFTESEIDKLQNCYGLAIRRSVNNL